MIRLYAPPDKCFILKSRTIREDIVPLPDAGAPKIIALITGERNAAIVERNVLRPRRARTDCKINSGVSRLSAVSPRPVRLHFIQRHLLI